MAEQKQANEYKFEDIIDVEHELQKRKDMISIALQPIDSSWTVHNTNDANISVAYKQIGTSNAYTVRGTMRMKGDIDAYYNYGECGYDDVYIRAVQEEDLCTEMRIVKLVDADHQIVYRSDNSGYWVIAPRDFTTIRSRFKETDYVLNNVKYKKIVSIFVYSVPDAHPFNVAVKDGHVRAKLINTGHILSQREGCDANEFEVCFILSMDPCGMIPQWIVNQFTPNKGMEVQQFVKDWPKVLSTQKDREQNQWKKQHKPMFEAPHPKLVYSEKITQQPSKKDTDESKESEK